MIMMISTLRQYVIVVIFILELSCGQPFDDILREVSLIKGTDCHENSRNCENSTTQTQNCRGRTTSPTMHVLSSGSHYFSYCVQSKALHNPPLPSSTVNEASRQFTFEASRTCMQELHLNNAVTVSLWIAGSCSPACEFLSFNDPQKDAINTLSLNGTTLTMKFQNTPINLATTWSHVVYRVSGDVHDIFVNGDRKHHTKPASSISNVSSLKFGPEKGFVSGGSVSFLDVRVYEDFLTDREIISLNDTGNLPGDDCRCPISYPNLRDDNTCLSEEGRPQARYLTSKFYDINAVLDNNISTVWAATNMTDVTLQLKLYDVYKLTEVKVILNNIKPSGAVVEINSLNYSCSRPNGINIICRNLSGNATKELNLHIEAPTSDQIYIADIIVTGRCDCYGNGLCTRPKKYQTYTCNCSSNRTEEKCKDCLADYSDDCCLRNKKPGTRCDECLDNYYARFDFCRPCNCTGKGVDRCNNVTGECICKEGFAGKYCTECKNEYYESDDVCEKCNCNEVGSSNLNCNKTTGQCQCIDYNTDTQCIPSGTISPTYGPLAGGTTVSINGKHFSGDPTVLFGGQVHDPISSNITNMIKIGANPGSSVGPVDVKVLWDNGNITLNQRFTYKPDPSVTSPGNQTNITVLRGCKLGYKGRNFDSVYQPRLEFKTSSGNCSQKFQVCQKITSESIECIVPQCLKEGTMESILHLDCPNCGVNQRVTIESDAEVKDDMDIDFTYPFIKTIEITGKHFRVCEKDIKIFIGGTECKELDVKTTKLTCEPPRERPAEKIKYDIVVQIGVYRNITVGTINYIAFVDSVYFVYIMTGVGAFILLAIIIFFLICCKCRRTRHKRQDLAMNISAPSISAQPNSYTEMQKTNIDVIRPPTGVQNSAFSSNTEDFEETKKRFLHKLPHGLKPEVGSCIIHENEFSFGKICTAKGDKARVIDGKLTKGNTTCQMMVKAIKKPFQDDEEYPDWVFKALTECVRFRNLTHPNILSIYGIGLEKRKFHILYPYMKNKTLKDFVSDEKKEFSLKQLLGYGVQLSEGMCFLYDHDIVHGDLATRNCMVSEDSLMKISDASFSHDFYPTEYMLDVTKNRYLPIRWMAPESIKFGFYDVKSDVWSYGVLLWELLTRGCLPFIDTADSGIYDLIVQGYRLGKPEIISDEIYELINKCWEEESEFRPSFTIIRDTLSDLMMGDLKGQDDLYINWTEPRQSIYMNSESFKRKSEKNNSEPYYGNL